MGNPVCWFEIPTKDLERAKTFYGTAFGWTFQTIEMGAMKLAMLPSEMQAYGTSGALVQADTCTPAQTGTLVYFSCPEVTTQLDRIEKAGGKVVLTKTSIGEHGYIGAFIDTEGNRVAVHSME